MALPCNNLNLNLYRVFYIVAKTKSFSESSRVLHISQPAISKHIQNLEYELDTTLFYRNNRGIELTPEAKNLLPYIEKAYNFLCLGEQELQDSKALSKGKVTIGIPKQSSVALFQKHITKFMKEHENISIEIIQKSYEELLELVEQHNIDILITPFSSNIPPYLRKEDITIEKNCFACLNSYTNKQIVTLKELSSSRIILPGKNTDSRRKLEDTLYKYDLSLEPILELEDSKDIMSYIKQGIGIGYIPESLLDDETKKIEIEEDLPRDIISLIYNDKTLTMSSKTFIETFKEIEQ